MLLQLTFVFVKLKDRLISVISVKILNLARESSAEHVSIHIDTRLDPVTLSYA